MNLFLRKQISQEPITLLIGATIWQYLLSVAEKPSPYMAVTTKIPKEPGKLRSCRPKRMLQFLILIMFGKNSGWEELRWMKITRITQ